MHIHAKRPKGRQRIESPQAVARTGEMGGDNRRSRSGMVRYTGLSEEDSRRCMGGVQGANYPRNMMEKRGKPGCQWWVVEDGWIKRLSDLAPR